MNASFLDDVEKFSLAGRVGSGKLMPDFTPGSQEITGEGSVTEKLSSLFDPFVDDIEGEVDQLQIAFDTNALMQIAKNDSFQVRLDSLRKFGNDISDGNSNFALGYIVPGQAFIEFFNNIDRISGNAGQDISKELKTLLRLLSSSTIEDAINFQVLNEHALGTFVESLQIAVEHLNDFSSPTDRSDSVSLMNEFLTAWDATTDTVPRSRLLEIGHARFAGKVPPGWKDAGSKNGQGYGDFYLWMDMLCSLHEVSISTANGRKIGIFVSNDEKPDWGNRGYLHPYLAMECHSITGYELYKLNIKHFFKLVDLMLKIGETNQNN